LISLRNVHKAFGEKKVLQGFSLEVPEGETMVIIGYSGSGKSVAIKHIVGLLEPDQGTVFVDGLEVPRLERRELYDLRAQIGYVFQFAALFDSMTIGDNVAMGLRNQEHLDEKAIHGRVAEALDLVDLPNVEERYPAELSGGMRKRVGLARAIALRPLRGWWPLRPSAYRPGPASACTRPETPSTPPTTISPRKWEKVIS
jgi:phospholipid/cholesterol/gamma-HCH transport system ATP-binding protein